MKKSSKRIVLSTERKNDKGFHVATGGIDLSQYLKNPILLFMHKRANEGFLPLGNGVDLEVKDGVLSFIPLFDDTDDFAMKIYNKVENGTIRMASAGLNPKKWEKRGVEPWLSESQLIEITLCDIGSNNDALPVELYNDDQIIKLSSDFLDTIIPKTKTEPDMKIELNAEKALPLVKLSQGSTGEQFLAEVEKAIQLNTENEQKILTLTKEKEKAEQAQSDAEAKVLELKAEADKAELIKLVDDGEAKGKITKEDREKFLGNKEKKIEPLTLSQAKTVLDLLPENKSVEEQLKGEGSDLLKLAADKSYDELEKEGLLVELKAKNFEVFNRKYKAKFGEDYVKED